MPRPLPRPRPRLRRRAAGSAAMITVAALALTACAGNEPLVDDPFSDIINSASGNRPLPPGAYYEAADSRAPEEGDRSVATSSYAPGTGTAEDRIPEIVDRGRIIVGVDPSLNLMSFRNATGELSGFEIDLSREISRDIFGDPDRVDFRYINSGERSEAIESGTVDVVIRTMTTTPSRNEVVDFSTPYLTSSTGLLSTTTSGIESAEDLGGRTVCVSGNTTSEEVAREIAADSMLLIVQNWGDCLTSIQQHQADAVITDTVILAGYAAQDSSLQIVNQQLTSENFAAAVEKGNTGLVRQINSTLERMRGDGSWNSIFDTWLGPYLPAKAQPPSDFITETESDTDSGSGTNSGDSADQEDS